MSETIFNIKYCYHKSSFPWTCFFLQPQNSFLGRYFKFLEMSGFLTICYFLWTIVYLFASTPKLNQIFWKIKKCECHSKLLNISQFHSFSLPLSLIMQLWNEFSHWSKSSGRRRGTRWILRRSDSSYLRSTISKEFLVQTSVPSWKSNLQRHMNRHIRRKVTTELATRLYTVWKMYTNMNSFCF